MGNKRNILAAFTAICGLFVLIIDTQTAISGAREGIVQCINVIVPSLFPFFLVSGLFCICLQQADLSILTPLRKLCRLPKGAESLFIIGLIGGYPVGAREISVAYESGRLSRSDAERMLGFCNNAGPSFIFGIIASQFANSSVGIWIFLIQVCSAVITAAILPGKTTDAAVENIKNSNFMSVFHGSIRAIASVCGWVILFRIVLSFLRRWLFWLLPDTVTVIISGLLELANGCTQLHTVQNDGLRMIISSALLSSGGICVYLQTISVTKNLRAGMYFPGKIIQCCISIILSFLVQPLLFERPFSAPVLYLIAPFGIALLGVFVIKHSSISKKRVAIQ